jgi:addiction module RelE/StbE family toxin
MPPLVRPHRLVYSRRYSRQLQKIYQRIAADNAAAAPRVIERIRIAVERLREFPAIGRSGRVEGTRELVIPGTPYIVPYRVVGDVVQIITVLHSAQRWPDRFP